MHWRSSFAGNSRRKLGVVLPPPWIPRGAKDQWFYPIKVNPDNIITPACEKQFRATLKDFDDVFNPVFSKYNQSLGPFKAVVNMGNVKPPQRKGRLPQYSRNRLVELQAEMDKLEELGVLAVPENLNVTVEYLNPSFLVKKQMVHGDLLPRSMRLANTVNPSPH